MKTILSLLTGVLLLSGCDHEAEMYTSVREDGSLIKTIELKKADREQITHNYFGISPESGWDYDTTRTGEKMNKLDIRFHREFTTVDEFNEVFSTKSDTTVHLKAEFSKEFRWFFTYLTYRETFEAADRFKHVDQENFFTPEDYAFINRLPAEGAAISRADSIFAESLNEKILDVYAMRGIYEDHFAFFENGVKAYGLAPYWKDTLLSHKEALYKRLLSKEGNEFDDDVLLDFMDSLSIPFPKPAIEQDYHREMARLEATLNYMSWVTDGTFVNHIEVPWQVVATNADTVAGNRLTWRPPTVKYLLQDFVMEVTSRKLNTWAIVLTGLSLAVIAFLLFRIR